MSGKAFTTSHCLSVNKVNSLALLGKILFFIEREGAIAHRQVLSVPGYRGRLPVLPVAIGLVIHGVIVAVSVVFRGMVQLVAPEPTYTPYPTPTVMPRPTAKEQATLVAALTELF